MKKTTSNLIMVNMIFVAGLITANMVGVKLWEFGISIGGVALAMSAGSITYAITFLMTDIVGEIWGKQEANKTVIRGFIAQIMVLVFVVIIRYLPTNNEQVQSAYIILIGQSPIVVFGSLVAYLLSQLTDVTIFHKIKSAQEKAGTQSMKLIRNNASTITSQLVDSITFTIIVFGIGFGFFAKGMTNVVIGIIVGQYIVKVIIAAIDTPFFYFLTRQNKNN